MIRQFLLVATSAIAVAQPPSPSMRVPVLGYIFDGNAKAIRLVSGVPGAASLDDVVPVSDSLTSAFVHSAARVAIANTKDGAVALVQWKHAPRLVVLMTSLGHVVQAAFNSSGDQAAITDGTLLEVWSGLGGDPAKTASYTASGGVAALALNPDGFVAVAARSGSIVLLSDKTRQVASAGQWTSLAFLPNGQDLLAADAAAQNLVLIRNAITKPAASTLLHLNQRPGALAVSADGSMAALSGNGTVTLASLAGGATQSIACKCQADHLELLAGNLVLHLADRGSASELLLDADRSQARIIPLLLLNGGLAQ